MEKFNFSKSAQKNELKIRNKLLNSILKISNLENNDSLCNLLFNEAAIFNSRYEGFTYLSFSEIIQNLLKYNTQKANDNYIKIIKTILIFIQDNELLDLFYNLSKKLFSEYSSIEFFFSLLLENFNVIEKREKMINERTFDIIIGLKRVKEIKKENQKIFLQNEIFRKMLIKIVFFILNTKGNYNIINNKEIFEEMNSFLNDINSDDNNFKLLLNELFKIFFIELYKVEEDKDISINDKFKYIGSLDELSDLDIKPLDNSLFDYFNKIINLFCSVTPTIEIINEIINYLDEIQYLFYQIFLQDYKLFNNNNLEMEIPKISNNFILCNFFHLFKSQILKSFYFYLIKYSKNNNSNVFDLFPEFKKILINIFNLCPFPFYLNLILDIFQDQEKLKENEKYLDELMEMIINIKTLELDKSKSFINTNRYKIQYFNIIEILKIFFIISYEPKNNDIFCRKKIIEYFLKFMNILKEDNLIYSNYLITLNNNNEEKINKTILEICYIIMLSFISTEKDSNKVIQYFGTFENRDKKSQENEQSLFYIFDKLNKFSNDIKNINYYKNTDFEFFLNGKKSEKQEKSLLILSFIYFIIVENKKIDKNFFKDNIVSTIVLLFKEIINLFKNSTNLPFQKIKDDNIYNSILEHLFNLNDPKKTKLFQFENFITIFKDIINRNNKTLKDYDPNYCINQINFGDNNECYFKQKCLLLMKRKSIYNNSKSEQINNQSTKYGDYFDIELSDIIKYFKSDLIFKDCSIYFNDIFFFDKNFDSIRKSLLIKYNVRLIDEKGRRLLDYPCRIKNYSSNKYAMPRVFLKYNNDYYNYKYFSIYHPDLNLNSFKKDSFPIFPTHYEYYDLFKNYIDILTISIDCELYSIKNIICGKLYFTDIFILFKNENKFDFKNLDYIFHSEKREITYNNKIILIKYNEIEEIISRTFLYNHQAVEIFMKNGKSYMFNLYQEKYLDSFYKIMNEKKSQFNFKIIKEPKKTFNESGYNKKWENNEINTYQYLLYINKYSGRTYNDLNQYPIFPWIFLNSSYSESKKSDDIIYRDMKYFILTQNQDGRKIAKNYYKNSYEDNNKKACHFLIHYSTSAHVILYLLRISPFTEQDIRLQNGNLDAPDRLLSSIDFFLKSLKNSKENRELIPEFFTSFEFLYNLNYIYLGEKLNKSIVHNIIVPKLFNSPEEYIYYNRLILNNSKDKNKSKLLPKCEINKWIDIVFGVNQFPGELDKFNKFDNYSYRQIKSTTKMLEKYKNKNLSNDKIIKALTSKFSRIIYFGQCPEQLFKNEHSNLKNKEKSEISIQIKKHLDFSGADYKIITFWINENKNIFFLVKANKGNKEMFILIYDEKLINIKSKIIIDKIKMFCCKNEFFTVDKKLSISNEFKCSIMLDAYENINSFNSFLVFNDDIRDINNLNQNDDNYTMRNLCDVYALNPKDSMFDIFDDFNIYLFVGRNYDNSIKIYTQEKKDKQLFGYLKTDSFVSVIYKINKEIFLTGHKNGKLLKWKIEYREFPNLQNNNLKLKKINDVKIKKEIFAHNDMISCIYYNERHNIIVSSDIKGFLYIRKYFDFELINRIVLNNNKSCFINKVILSDYDILCTINFNIYKNKNYISFYSLNGILLEVSKNIITLDTYFLKNGKMIFNCLNEKYLSIFGFNDKDNTDNTGKIIEYDIFRIFAIKKDLDHIKNFYLDNNEIYILLKNGMFIKGYNSHIDSLSLGVDKFKES